MGQTSKNREGFVLRKLNNAVDRFCILHPRFGIPNLMLYIVIGNIAIYLLASFSSQSYQLLRALSFSLRGLLQGDIWRLVTFAIVPSGGGIMFFLYCYFTYSMGRTLEQQWGTAKFTCYYLGGLLLTVLGASLASVITGMDIMVSSASDVTFAMFLAFAILFPDATFVLFPLPIPIRARYIAYFDLLYFAFMILAPIIGGQWYSAVTPLMALLNVSIMIWPELSRFLKLDRGKAARQAAQFRDTAEQARQAAARQAFARKAAAQRQQASAGERKCAVCGRTNLTNPELDFRYCSRCAGYHCFCSDHIFTHVHFTEDQL